MYYDIYGSKVLASNEFGISGLVAPDGFASSSSSKFICAVMFTVKEHGFEHK